MIVLFVPDLLYSIERAFDQNVISTYELYSGFSTGYGPRLVPYSRALFKLISVTCEMAESMRLAAVVPLNGKNYPTWKIQCRMALMKEGLWSIVSEEETEPQSGRTEIAKFRSRRDKALATIVLSVDIALLYLIGNSEHPAAVWKKLADQFEKKTWATRLDLRRKLHSMRLKEGNSAQEHIKNMTELFDALTVAGETVSDEDRVVYVLASLPDSYNVLVTALEANAEVPKIEVVTERILHQERKTKEKETDSTNENAMPSHTVSCRPKPKCFNCGKVGHIQRYCRAKREDQDWIKEDQKERKDFHKQKVTVSVDNDSDTNGDDCGLANSADCALPVIDEWIIDSGATTHMCSNKKAFTTLYQLESPIKVTVGDGRALTAIGRGDVVLNMECPSSESESCTLHDVLYVPELSYNLVSVAKVSQKGKIVKFTSNACYILDKKHKMIAKALKVEKLYRFKCKPVHEHAGIATNSKEDIWHKRFGHLGVSSLQRLSHDRLVDGFDYDASQQLTFCETCPQGKQHRTKFPSSDWRAGELLGLVHSDVCGKMNEKSLGGAEYFLSFIDDKTRYVWVYFLRTKGEVYEKFLEWKAMVELATEKRLKAIRTDNGGEYTSRKFQEYLKTEGVRHELTVPKNPEQNGVAERINRTLIETARSMLIDSHLPHSFWAEAISTAAYLRNRSPTKAVAEMTPYEAWTGKRPQVDGLRVFGCQAFVHIPKDERKKLDSKSRRCIFWGYGVTTKGYRLYDPMKKKVCYSRDVIFMEDKYNQLKPEEEAERRVYLEYSDEPDETADNPEPLHQSTIDYSDESDEATDNPELAPLRRSTRKRRSPDYYGHQCNLSITEEPKCAEDALKEKKWRDAMKAEINSLHQHNVWDLVECPKGCKPVGSKWVFKVKTNADGSTERFKARLVAQGYTQKVGLDYDETFSPVVRSESIRSVISLACKEGLKLHQMDVTTAFLNSELDQVIYMKQPEGFAADGQEHLVCRLKKSLYGLKQSSRCWNQVLDAQLKGMGFQQSQSDPCVYTSKKDGLFIIAVYVDDILLCAKSEETIAQVKQDLEKCFQLKDMGELHYFLGINVKRNYETGKMWIGQPEYTKAVLKNFGMEKCKPANTPVTSGTKLLKATDESERVDSKLYQSAVGCLLYLSGWTRPDIAYSVGNVARFCSDPTEEHWTAVKRIFRYLQGTANYGLEYSKQNGDGNLVGFSDADWAGDPNDRKSTSGYIFVMNGGAISWKSRKQTCVALSTAEAEYVALASAAQETAWIRQLLNDLHHQQDDPTILFEDNQAAVAISKNSQLHTKMKHIAIRYHYVREKALDKTIDVQYCPTNDMVADILTKGLTLDKFLKLRELSGIKDLSDFK